MFNTNLPIIQAPMAGADTVELASAVAEAGGLGSFACAFLTPLQLKNAWAKIRAITQKPIGLNFFCHTLPPRDENKQRIWRQHLGKYYAELNINIDEVTEPTLRMPFDKAMCDVVGELKPEVVSFHFGLPEQSLFSKVKSTGAKIVATATTVEEAKWLEKMGCDAIIAQGIEAGGHRGMFLTEDLSTQTPTLLLIQSLKKTISKPIIAAGGIGDAKGVAEAIRMGASAVQLGTAYLFCLEAHVSAIHLKTLTSSDANETAITNVYSGRPARGIMTRLMRELTPMCEYAPPFPYASTYITPLRQKSEKNGSTDFAQMWAGENYRLGKVMPAGDLTRRLAQELHS